MKKITTIFALFALFSCKAQQIIVPLGSDNDALDSPNYYIKDVNSLLDKYVGTWKYTNSNTEVTIVLKKEIHYATSNNTYYEDLLVGEYQYVKDGIIIVNTLADMNNPIIKGYRHKISGGILISKFNYPACTSCGLDEKRVELFINHPIEEFAQGRLVLRHILDVNGERLESHIYDKSTLGDGIVRINIPDGEYTFIKQ